MSDTPRNPDRRVWLKNAATIAGGAAAGSIALPSATVSAQAATAAAAAASGRGPVLALADRNIVETTAGKIHGFSRGGIQAFKGIPYGATTAGTGRFMAPTKPKPWAGVRSSMALGFASPQAFHIREGRRAGWARDEQSFMFEWNDGQPDDECLNLNVWTPGASAQARRPVLVWIHGGGFSSGSSDELKAYDGESLARRGDVVVVSINHRLGVLGFLNLAEYGSKWTASGISGMLDTVLALEWVRDNIASFGGDPSRVLIFGQSGGGGKVSTLMGMPSAKGLFHRAAIQSGSGLRQQTPDRSAAVAKATLDQLGLTAATVDKIQSLPWDAIVRAGLLGMEKLNTSPGGGAPAGGAYGWGPTVDGRFLPRHPWDPAAPEPAAGVPLLVGTVLNEQNNAMQAGDFSLDAMSMDEMRKRLVALRGNKADEIIAVYRKKFPTATPYDILSRVGGMTGRMNAVTQATLKAAQGAAPAYLYRFEWQTPVLGGRPRAFHCSELPFVFNNTDRCAPMTGGGDDARGLGAKIADAWVAFAKTGSPNHAGLPNWPAFSAAQCQTMVFDNACAVKNNPDKDEREVLA